MRPETSTKLFFHEFSFRGRILDNFRAHIFPGLYLSETQYSDQQTKRGRELPEVGKSSKYVHCKKGLPFSQPQQGCHLPNFPWTGIIWLFPSRESLFCDIPPGDGKNVNFFLPCRRGGCMGALKTKLFYYNWGMPCKNYRYPVFRIRIHRIHMFLGLPDPDLDPLVRGKDPDPDPSIQCCGSGSGRIRNFLKDPDPE